ncbi:MAG TPA: hypothetical protein VHM65_06970 [Candidatus Lustribacter sp.]|nr:hypothetical protein [Candidatus Lustribacter sp.]
MCHYRFALHPRADAAAFEALMSARSGEDTLQLTRVTSGFSERLLEVRRPADADEKSHHPGPQYVWEVTVNLVSGDHYDFAASADRVQEVAADLATLVSVESFRTIETVA